MLARCETAMRANLPALRADQQLLEGYGLASTSERAYDAGPVLNARLEWDTAGNSKGDTSGAASPGVSAELRAEVESLGRDWVMKQDEFRSDLPDLSWLSGIRAYDHWNVYDDERSKRWRELPTFSLAVWFDHPFPKIGDVLLLEKLRLLEAIRRGRLSSAAQETRHLANLAISTNNILGAVLGFRLNEYAERAETAESGTAMPTTYSAERRAEVMDALFRLAGFFSPLASPDDLEEIFLSDPSPAGLCIALHEGFYAPALVRLPLTTGGSTQARFEARYQMLDRILETHAEGCGLETVLELWERPPSLDAWNEINRTAEVPTLDASSSASRGAAMMILAKSFNASAPICAL